MHIDPSITLLELETEQLFKQLRHFVDHVCPAFNTYELKREAEARQRAKQRREAKAASANKTDTKRKGKAKAGFSSASAKTSESGPRQKLYHLNTIKYHSLPDYPKTIREFGTTDSYSTEPVSLSSIV